MNITIPTDTYELEKLAKKYDVEYTPHTPMKFIISRTCRKIYPVGEWWQQAELWQAALIPECEVS